MNTRQIAFSVLFASMTVQAVPQTKGQASKGLGLSPEFSTAATELVRSIDSYEGVTEVGIPDISDALAAASGQAHSPGELQAMTALRTFLEDKMDNNSLRAQTIARAISAWKKKHPGVGASADEEATVRMDALELPGVREMTHREDDCAAELRLTFSLKAYRVSTHCADVRLRHDEHAMLQFFPQTAGS